MAAAILFVVLTDLRTWDMLPRWDGQLYFAMAQRGLDAHLEAPFAYRPALPFLARWLAALSPLNVMGSYRLLVRVFAVLTLALAYMSARRLGARPGAAGVIAFALGLCFYQIRFPLFLWSMVDIAAYPLMLLAFGWIWQGRLVRAGIASSVGLLFKEFLLVPLAVVLLESGRAFLRERAARRHHALVFAGVALLGAAFFLAPRVAFEVQASFQAIDPVKRPETLDQLWKLPLQPERWLGILAAYVFYWLPTLLFSTRERWSVLRRDVRPFVRPLLAYLVLLLLLVMYGGSNLGVFAAYAIAGQVLVLALMLRTERPRVVETLWIGAALVVANRWLVAIPDPLTDLDAYLAFHDHSASTEVTDRLALAAGLVVFTLAMRVFEARRRVPKSPVA